MSNLGSVAGNITDNAVLDFANPTVETYGGIISGTGSVTVNGPGLITLSGNNTYTAATIVNSGTLQLGSNAALGSGTSGVTVANGGTLDLNDFTPNGNPTITIAGAGSAGQGALTSTNGTLSTAYNVSLSADAMIAVPDGDRLNIGNSGVGTLNGNGYSLTLVAEGTASIDLWAPSPTCPRSTCRKGSCISSTRSFHGHKQHGDRRVGQRPLGHRGHSGGYTVNYPLPSTAAG